MSQRIVDTFEVIHIKEYASCVKRLPVIRYGLGHDFHKTLSVDKPRQGIVIEHDPQTVGHGFAFGDIGVDPHQFQRMTILKGLGKSDGLYPSIGTHSVFDAVFAL
ncbi:hypothetical protein SDC9_155951 [bioreactor metagenome]|uniref:Uncharacterized protein n=1 Tax=bioreactor metagenome TaxID=1076179 RepID=A0A645F4W4_9ZZZZ